MDSNEAATALAALELRLADAHAAAARLAAEIALLTAQLHMSPPLTAAQGLAAAIVARARAANATRRRSEPLTPVPTRQGETPAHWPHLGFTPKDLIEGSPHLVAKLLGDYGLLSVPLVAAPLPGESAMRAALGSILGCVGE